ncbi:hypothetical protein QFC24_004733 [Naganishia onofrii]|uniref:Uncharacterized protein n=1 Tax=Naganishia onofrii TaxID=1851511 RepID=A0ACC2XDE6_9TREE|nr:hypothetical protein QFC24_004733 [Naganishia onofrii]
MKEKTLANSIVKVLTLNDNHASILQSWDDEGKIGQAACLGEEVQKVAQLRGLSRGSTSGSTLSILKLDRLLDELACHSPFSDLGTERPKNPRSREAILYEIYSASGLSPLALSYVTQIILQDLRPITCPLPTGHHHPSIALQLSASCKPPPPLDIFDAMATWDWEMRDMYRVCGDLDAVCREVERLGGGAGRRKPGKATSRDPIVGLHVEIPKCEKGRSIQSALKMIAGPNGYKTKQVWAETKYDGERMQIHVWMQDGEPCVKIYSKSKRDSTKDRKNTHSIILAALGLRAPATGYIPQHHQPLSKRLESIPYTGPLVTSVILEAEMLPYNESGRKGGKGPGIEEFWHLGGISSRGLDNAQDGSRHLYLSYFDILHINGQSLLDQSYNSRRSLLESVIRIIPGFCQLAERTNIDISQGMASAAAQLNAAFQRSSDRLEEGLVLKAAESTYNDRSLRWIKLKKDYIPGYGDCVDLAILAIGWDKDRARQLRGKSSVVDRSGKRSLSAIVGPSVMTTLYTGVLTNKAQVAQRKQDPHFEILFRVSYGLTKQQLAELNNALGRPPFQTRKFDPSGVRHQVRFSFQL